MESLPRRPLSGGAATAASRWSAASAENGAAQAPDTHRRYYLLPAPTGPFNLLMRLHAPKNAVLMGDWKPSAVVRQGRAAMFQAE